MILNSTVLPRDCTGKAAMHFILLFRYCGNKAQAPPKVREVN